MIEKRNKVSHNHTHQTMEEIRCIPLPLFFYVRKLFAFLLQSTQFHDIHVKHNGKKHQKALKQKACKRGLLKMYSNKMINV